MILPRPSPQSSAVPVPVPIYVELVPLISINCGLYLSMQLKLKSQETDRGRELGAGSWLACVWHYFYIYWLFCCFVEGSWDRVHQVIGQAHTILHEKGIVRIHTDIRVGTRWVCFFLIFFILCSLLILSCVIHFSLLTVYIRTDKVQSFEDKVTKVQQILGKK